MTLSADFERSASTVVLVILWTGIIIWLRRGRTPAPIALVLLLLYLAYPLYVLIEPAGQRDPAMHAAEAGLVAIVLLLTSMIALLAIGVSLRRRWLVWTAFVVSMIPVFIVSCSALVYVIGLCLKK
jgi:hypothetical protein